MDLSRVQAVLLDMDGTLVDSDAAVERSWLSWAREYPVDPGRGPLVAHGLPAVGNVRRLGRTCPRTRPRPRPGTSWSWSTTTSPT